MTDDRRPWDRLENETPKAYAAFCVYRDLPTKRRSLDAAYVTAKGLQPDYSKRASKAWTLWSAKYDWPARAAAHDDLLAELNRKRMEERHLADLEQYRNEIEKLNGVLMSASVKGLQLLVEKLDKLQPDGIEDASIPNWLRSLASIAETASNAKAQALSINDLLGMLED